MKPLRDPQWLRFIRSLPCLVCSKTWGIEAAHTGPHGLGQKSSDASAIPLCVRHHRFGDDSLHSLGPLEFERLHRLDIQAVLQALTAKPLIAIEDGKFVGRFPDGSEYQLGPATHESAAKILDKLRRLRFEEVQDHRQAAHVVNMRRTA